MSGPHGRAQNNTEAGSQGPGLRVPFTAGRRLVRLLVAKAALDLLFVTALALNSGYAPSGTRFEGAIDYAYTDAVRGWVTDTADAGRPVEVQLFLNGEFVASAVADKSADEGADGGRLAFVFKHERPQYGDRQARVYAVCPSEDGTRRTLQLLGSPVNYAGK